MTEKIVISNLNSVDIKYQRERINNFKSFVKEKGFIVEQVIEKHKGHKVIIKENDNEKKIQEVTKKFSCSFNKEEWSFFISHKENISTTRKIQLVEIIIIIFVIVSCLYIQLFNRPDKYNFLSHILPFVSYII